MTKTLTLAADPSTPARRLFALATHGDRAVREAVASNPNTSIKGLFKLLDEFPAQVTGNAALALLLLEDTHLFLRAGEQEKEAWARNPGVPVWLLEQLATGASDGVRRALAVNPSTPVEILEVLAFPDEFRAGSGDDEDDDDDDGDWVEACVEVLANPSLPDGLRFDVLLSVSDLDLDFVSLPPGTEEELEDLLGDDINNEFTGLPLIGDSLPIERVWAVACGDEETDENTTALGLLQRVDQGVFAQVRDFEGAVWGLDDEGEFAPAEGWSLEDERSLWGLTPRELVANEATPAHLLRRLLHHHDARVRAGLAAHPAAQPAQLTQLAQDTEFVVRLAAASSTKTPPTALMWLSHDESGAVRRAVASNPFACEVTLARLAQDRRPSVRKAASQNTLPAKSARARISTAA